MTICLIAIFKNEASIMKEWLDHYIKEGIEHFFLIDNGSDDDYMKILQEYIDNNLVTLVIDSRRHMQRELYNEYFLELSKAYEWVIVCDLDEFIYSRKNMKTIRDYLNSLDESISQVKIQWKMFGSSGYIEQPISVIKSFTKRVNYDIGLTQGVILENNKKYSMCKTIVRGKFLLNLGIHSHLSSNTNIITSDGSIDNGHDNSDFILIDEDILENSYLHINHYAIQSYKWFMKVKFTRGSANSKTGDKDRSETYFKEFDINNKEDLELSLKSYSSSESGKVVSIISSSSL
jgi:hypothetical protein